MPHKLLHRLTRQERLNFLLTNRIPRRLATRFMGWFSRIEQPWIRDLSMATWRWFADDLDLSDARKSQFQSLHDCFTRELRPGARPLAPDPDTVISPCDAIIGAHGRVEGTTAYQAKGFPYSIEDLLPDRSLVERYRDGIYVTLRLTSTMYHRFHAPLACQLREVIYISGDTWNVNPVALKRVERLFCRNERAVLDLNTGQPGQNIALVPVAAILVASIRLHCLPEALSLRYRGPNRIPCRAEFNRGEEMGYFQHGSTIIVFASGGFHFAENVAEGSRIRMGQPLLIRG